MDFSKQFGDMSEKMKGLASKGKSMLKPPPVIFGSPRQMATEPDLSWWHIPVFIQPTALQKKSLEDCTVQLVPYDGGGAALDMRWRTKDAGAPVKKATLEEDRVYLIPIAARKEAGKRLAILTNETFLAEKKAKWTMPPGKSKWTVRVSNEDGKWESEHSYVLFVPPADRGNGHFILEVRYEGRN